jgi:hypothetical protein
LFGQGKFNGGLCVNQGGVDQWNRAVFGAQKHPEFRAAQDDGLGATRDQSAIAAANLARVSGRNTPLATELDLARIEAARCALIIGSARPAESWTRIESAAML